MNVLLVSTGLNARVRLESLGVQVTACRPDQLEQRLRPGAFDAVVIDLDEVGGIALPDSAPNKVLGFYSHVDEETAQRARAAGIDAYPRSRFWREAKELLS